MEIPTTSKPLSFLTLFQISLSYIKGGYQKNPTILRNWPWCSSSTPSSFQYIPSLPYLPLSSSASCPHFAPPFAAAGCRHLRRRRDDRRRPPRRPSSLPSGGGGGELSWDGCRFPCADRILQDQAFFDLEIKDEFINGSRSI